MKRKKVRIAGHNYKIKLETCELENRLCGKIDYNKNTIIIQKDMKESRKEEVLAHEILHGILEKAGAQDYITSINGNVENLCCMIENTFWQFLKDNTNFFDRK